MKPKVLFDIGHPAHIHLFKNFIYYLEEKDIPYVITSRHKEITNNLIAHFGFKYHSLSKPGKTKFAMFFELLTRDIKILLLHFKHRFTHAFGTSVSIAHLSFITKVKSYNFNEDDDDVVPLYTSITYPFTTKIINPDCIKYKKWGNKRIFVPSYHELAYLHPDNFSPDEAIIKKYGLKKGSYVVLRLSALQAHHDTDAKGINPELKNKIKSLLANYDLIESNEGKTGGRIEPWDMHHVLAFAKMIVSDSQTMTIEAAVLGIPAVRINTFIGKSTVIDELENTYQLAYGFFPHDETNILNTIKTLASNPDISEAWQQKRQKLLTHKTDLNKWMIGFFEKIK